jgi:hypothetical protein
LEDEGEASAGEQETWEELISRVRAANYGVSKLVTNYERCVAVQGAPGEDAGNRVENATKLEEVRRQVILLYEGLHANLAEGSSDNNKSAFFTECYNFTSSVDRFTKALDRSLRKQRKVMEKNRSEMDLMKRSAILLEDEREDAVAQCLGFENMCAEKEGLVMKVQEDLQGRIAELRRAASASLQHNANASEELAQPASVSIFGGRRKTVGLATLVVLVVCVVHTLN